MKPGSPNTQQYCCCAIGSRDRSVSVWLTSLKRPLVVIKELFDDSVLDLSWHSDGLYLLACSWDGTIACIIFTASEIGTPLSASEKVCTILPLFHSLPKTFFRICYMKDFMVNRCKKIGIKVLQAAKLLKIRNCCKVWKI